MMKLSKTASLAIVFLVYLAAFFTGLLAVVLLPFEGIFAYLCADAAATIAVCAFGLVFKNASVYDPYWSAAPFVLYVCFLADTGHADAVDMLYLVVFAVWGVRLTLNWAIGWRGMAHEDWRYAMLREKNPKLWFLTDFFGINMMPTLFVFANMIPAYFCAVSADDGVNALSITGAAVCFGAILIQTVSDGQMRKFRKESAGTGRSIETGLWKYSRHPNYFGEVSMWWGVWLIQMSVQNAFWWTAAAPVLMTLLFVLISIPMMENRLVSTKQGYESYRKRTSMLLLLPARKPPADESLTVD